MLWTDETVDVIGDFIANYPLYQRLNLKDYLRQQDPDYLDHVDESEEPPIYKAETVIKYCPSERCKAERPYRRTSFTSGLGGVTSFSKKNAHPIDGVWLYLLWERVLVLDRDLEAVCRR